MHDTDATTTTSRRDSRLDVAECRNRSLAHVRVWVLYGKGYMRERVRRLDLQESLYRSLAFHGVRVFQQPDEIVTLCWRLIQLTKAAGRGSPDRSGSVP